MIFFCKSSQRKVLSNQQITVGNTTLKEATFVKCLSVKFDSGFKFHEDKSILGEIAVVIRTLSFIAQKLPLMTRLALLECLVMSNLSHSTVLLTYELATVQVLPIMNKSTKKYLQS